MAIKDAKYTKLMKAFKRGRTILALNKTFRYD